MKARLVGTIFVVAFFAGLSFLADRYMDAFVDFLASYDLVMSTPQFVWMGLGLAAFWVLALFSLSDSHPVQKVLSLLVRTALVLALVLGLSDIHGVTTVPKKVCTFVLVDTSQSMPDEAVTQGYAFAGKLDAAKKDNIVKLFAFSDVIQEVPLGPQGPASPIQRVGSGVESDIRSALRSLYGIFPEGYVNKVVIVTDGIETKGNVLEELGKAKDFGISVSTTSFPDLEPKAEFLVKKITVPDDIVIKQKATFEAAFFSTGEATVSCTVTVNGKKAKSQDFPLVKGTSTLPFDLTFDEGGTKKLDLSCTADKGKDFFEKNNSFVSVFKVPEIPKVLYVEGEQNYSKNLLSAISEEFDVEFRSAGGLPKTFEEIKKFDLVFMSDLPRFSGKYGENISYTQMKVLEQYVKSGGGLIVSGGEKAFGPGDYAGTYLEQNVLPVTSEVLKKKNEPGLGLVLVIDRSGSMTGPKIELTKEAAKATTEVLSPDDMISVIAFDTVPMKIVKLQKTSNKIKILNNISQIMAGGGTEILPALEMANADLAGANVKVKHIILLTDGKSPSDGIVSLVSSMFADGITISTVAVGEDADKTLLSQIAQVGGGRYYYTNNAQNIPKLFLKEASTLTRQAVVDEPFKPSVSKKYAHLQMLKGINFGSSPYLLGYVAVKAKKGTEVIMSTHLGEPLLVRWRKGLGKVVVWSSDVKNKWSHYWLSWPGYAQFWRQVIRDTARSEKDEEEFAMTAQVTRGMLTVTVDAVSTDGEFMSGIKPSVVLVDPDGKEAPFGVTPIAPGIFMGEKQLDVFGPYQIKGTFLESDTDDTLVATGSTQVSYPYNGEFLEVGTKKTVLDQIPIQGGGTTDPSVEMIFDPGDEVYSVKESMRHIPLFIAFALFFLDLLMKRIKIIRPRPLSLFKK